MKRRHVITAASCAGLVMAIALVLLGCELFQPTDVDNYFEQNPYQSEDRDEVNPGDLTIDPTAATVEWIGEKLVFTVDGGNEPFKWRVAESDNGSIKRMDNDRQAVYKAKSISRNVVIAEDANGRTIAAPINATIPALNIIPGAAIIPAAVGSTAEYRALGGVPPYEWRVGLPGLATVTESGSNNEYATYESITTSSGTNVLFVVDQASSESQVQVIHE